MRVARPTGFDSGLLLAVLALLAIGLPAVYSASHVQSGWTTFARQAIWAAVGLIGLGAMAASNYRSWSRYWRLLFLLTVIGLLVTLLVARPVNGARSWIDLGILRLQPSEFAKLALILAFASLLSRFGPRVRTLSGFLRTFLFFVAPMLLVLAQPDVGTAAVLGGIWFAMALLGGARWWMVAGLCGVLALTFTAAWHLDLIRDYQKKRLSFLHADPVGGGYHQRQARIAIGAGQWLGKGYLRGTQARGGFLPEQQTDFIYAVIGEELGFVGCLAVLSLYLFILLRILRIAEEADTPFGSLLVGGVAAMIGLHVLINIGMTLTLLPVTGVPLPLISYGGSNLLTTLLCIGVVLSVSRHRQARRTWADNRDLVRL